MLVIFPCKEDRCWNRVLTVMLLHYGSRMFFVHADVIFIRCQRWASDLIGETSTLELLFVIQVNGSWVMVHGHRFN